MGIRETKELLIAERPDIAIITHYHLDHSTWGPLVLEYSNAELFIPEGGQNCRQHADGFFRRNTRSLWTVSLSTLTIPQPLIPYQLLLFQL